MNLCRLEKPRLPGGYFAHRVCCESSAAEFNSWALNLLKQGLATLAVADPLPCKQRRLAFAASLSKSSYMNGPPILPVYCRYLLAEMIFEQVRCKIQVRRDGKRLFGMNHFASVAFMQML